MRAFRRTCRSVFGILGASWGFQGPRGRLLVSFLEIPEPSWMAGRASSGVAVARFLGCRGRLGPFGGRHGATWGVFGPSWTLSNRET